MQFPTCKPAAYLPACHQREKCIRPLFLILANYIKYDIFIVKQLFWIGNSYKALTAFPREIKQAAGFQLHLIQQGHDPDDWKPMQGIGANVREIRVHVAGEHRIIYLAKFAEGVYILHAFQKKTQKTAKKDLDIARARFRDVIQHRTSQ
jgi:phage-related protein